MYSKQKKAVLKKCQICDKLVPQFWKTLTIQGIRKKVCQRCAERYAKDKEKQKKEKIQIRKRNQKAVITEKKLDRLQSKVIRTLYGDKCCTCERIAEFSKNHCGHAISRRYRSVRFNPQNTATQCPTCNLYFQGEQYKFGNFINTFHGEGTMDNLLKISRSDVKIGQIERNLLYKIYEEALDHRDLQKLIQDYYKIIPF